jgi:sporulation protein YlmC with PRC-barrel domain
MRYESIAAIAALLAGSTALAQPAASSVEPPTAARVAAAAAEAPPAARARHLVGKNLENASGEGLGKVEELLIDTASGRVTQVVVAVGGVLGMGDKSVVLPWDRVRIDYGMNSPTTSQPHALLGTDPGVDTGGSSGKPGVGNEQGGQQGGNGDGRSASTPLAPGDVPGALTTPARRAGVRSADLRIVTDMTKKQLEAAPGFRDEDARPAGNSDAGAKKGSGGDPGR